MGFTNSPQASDIQFLMAQAAFILLRIVAGLVSLGALAVTILIIFFNAYVSLLKDGGHVLMILGRFLVSGLRDPGPAPPPHTPVPLSLFGLAVIFLVMFCSAFTPNQKIFLHITAAMAIAAAAWRIWSMIVTRDNQLIYLPVLALWFIYYILCLRRMTLS